MATSASSSAGREAGAAASVAAAEAERHEQHKALREDFVALCTAHSEVSDAVWWHVGVYVGGEDTNRLTADRPLVWLMLTRGSLTFAQGLRNEQLREHFGARYLQLVPIINTCLQEVSRRVAWAADWLLPVEDDRMNRTSGSHHHPLISTHRSTVDNHHRSINRPTEPHPLHEDGDERASVPSGGPQPGRKDAEPRVGR